MQLIRIGLHQRVVDLGQVYAGPYCTSQLAFLGTDVIKIEPPRAGEYLRMPRPGQVSYAFLMLNANKRSVTLDLKNERAREILLRLLETTDVLVENYLEGAMEKLGLGYEQVAARFPRLVYASGRGYGSDSDWSRMGATDYTVVDAQERLKSVIEPNVEAFTQPPPIMGTLKLHFNRFFGRRCAMVRSSLDEQSAEERDDSHRHRVRGEQRQHHRKSQRGE